MHPLLACLLLALSTSGIAGTGGAIEAFDQGPEVDAELGADAQYQMNETTTQSPTTESTTMQSTTTESTTMQSTNTARAGTGYKVGAFFVRFGPSILVVGFLAWILLTRD